jgi:hypothetical protein
MHPLKPAARAALQAMGDDDGPTVADRERLRQRIFGTIAAGGTLAASGAALGAPSATAAGNATSGTLTGTLGAKLGWWGSAVVGLAVGGLVGSAVAISTELVVENARPAPSAHAPSALARSRPKSARAESAAPPSPATAPLPSASSIENGPAGTDDGSPRAMPRFERDSRAPQTLERVTEARAAGQSETRGPTAEEAASAPGIRDELALLERAHRELARGNASASLTILDDHALRFPNGAFTAERTAARVFALCALGRVEHARVIGAEFLRAAPASPLVPRIRSSCAGARP